MEDTGAVTPRPPFVRPDLVHEMEFCRAEYEALDTPRPCEGHNGSDSDSSDSSDSDSDPTPHASAYHRRGKYAATKAIRALEQTPKYVKWKRIQWFNRVFFYASMLALAAASVATVYTSPDTADEWMQCIVPPYSLQIVNAIAIIAIIESIVVPGLWAGLLACYPRCRWAIRATVEQPLVATTGLVVLLAAMWRLPWGSILAATTTIVSPLWDNVWTGVIAWFNARNAITDDLSEDMVNDPGVASKVDAIIVRDVAARFFYTKVASVMVLFYCFKLRKQIF